MKTMILRLCVIIVPKWVKTKFILKINIHSISKEGARTPYGVKQYLGCGGKQRN